MYVSVIIDSLSILTFLIICPSILLMQLIYWMMRLRRIYRNKNFSKEMKNLDQLSKKSKYNNSSLQNFTQQNINENTKILNDDDYDLKVCCSEVVGKSEKLLGNLTI